jgi:hypothetical protein
MNTSLITLLCFFVFIQGVLVGWASLWGYSKWLAHRETIERMQAEERRMEQFEKLVASAPMDIVRAFPPPLDDIH